jgi:hypothetical protein
MQSWISNAPEDDSENVCMFVDGRQLKLDSSATMLGTVHMQCVVTGIMRIGRSDIDFHDGSE